MTVYKYSILGAHPLNSKGAAQLRCQFINSTGRFSLGQNAHQSMLSMYLELPL